MIRWLVVAPAMNRGGAWKSMLESDDRTQV
jgi:hypothetical protein